ncbi:hypothetical protein NC652_004656 [Populus alba x Populus x berolinensis]|nr:hypothetical protein NC652_004656 [Populus alba x Populus x berolinensis]
MGAVFEKIVTYYDIRIIRLSLEALLSRMGKRRRFPDIEQDRDIQTQEDKLGFCEKRNDLLKYTRSAERAIKYHNKKHKGAKFKLVEIISACSFFSMGVWEHINFTASEDDKSLKLFFAELSHGEAHWGRNHNTEAEKITACCLLEEGIYSRDSLVIFMLFVEELSIMHPYPLQHGKELHHKYLCGNCRLLSYVISIYHMIYPAKFIKVGVMGKTCQQTIMPFKLSC